MYALPCLGKVTGEWNGDYLKDWITVVHRVREGKARNGSQNNQEQTPFARRGVGDLHSRSGALLYKMAHAISPRMVALLESKT
jgi:hypothetical protein